MSTTFPRLVFAAPDGTCFIRLLSQHTSFGKVQEWVQRKMRLAAGESFQATYACDLLDGSGIREVMLDDEEDIETLKYLSDNRVMADEEVHITVRITPAARVESRLSEEDVAQASIPSEDFQRLLQMLAFPSESDQDVKEDVADSAPQEEDVQNHLSPNPTVLDLPETPIVSSALPSAEPSTVEIPKIISTIHHSTLSPIAPVFEPTAEVNVPSIAIEAASSIASSVSGFSQSDTATHSRSSSPALAEPAVVQPVRASKPSGLAILARRLPSPPQPTNTAAAAPSEISKAVPTEGGQRSFRPSAHTPAVAAPQKEVVKISKTPEADEFLASRSFEELRWSDIVDTPPRTRTVPGASSVHSSASPKPIVDVVVVGSQSARNEYRHLSVDANRWADLASETKTPPTVDHVSSSGEGPAPAHTPGAVAFAGVQVDGEEFATITAEKEWEGFSLDEIRLRHYQRQQSPAQNRNTSSSSTSTRRFVSSSTGTQPSPTSSNAPSTPGDVHTPAPSSLKFASVQPFTPPPAKPVFTGFSHTPSPEQVTISFTTMTHVPEFGTTTADDKPNKRVKVGGTSSRSVSNETTSSSSTNASPLLVSYVQTPSTFPVPIVTETKRSITPTGVEYTSLRSLFPSLFEGKPEPKPLERPKEVKSWLAEEKTSEYKREGRCFRCSAVGHLKSTCPF